MCARAMGECITEWARGRLAAACAPRALALCGGGGGDGGMHNRRGGGGGARAQGELQELVQFVRASVPRDAIIATNPATAGTLLLTTGRRMALHPHAEDVEIRERYRLAYQARADI